MKRVFAPAAALFAVAASLAAAPAAQANTYSIEPSHTAVTFEADHFNTSTLRGRFDKKEGTVEFDPAKKVVKIDLTIDTTSINTGLEPFNGHLKSKDFFNAAEFPTAKFVADKAKFNGDKVSEVTGTLTLLGKTQPVTLKAERFNCYDNPMFKRQVCGGDFTTTIKRSQWGMDYGVDKGMVDNIRLLVQVEAVKQ
jgi:polyisoprenoid-binding protein YceI